MRPPQVIEEYRIVAVSDDRISLVEIQVRENGGPWKAVGKGVAQRMKGDSRNQALGHLLAFNRACEEAIENSCKTLAAMGYGPSGEPIEEARRNGDAEYESK